MVICFSLGFDVGRGTGSFDEEGRQFVVSSISMKIWHVKEYSYQLLPEEEYGHFFSSEGKWAYPLPYSLLFPFPGGERGVILACLSAVVLSLFRFLA